MFILKMRLPLSQRQKKKKKKKQIFDSPVIKAKTKPSTEKRPDFNAAIKVSKAVLNTQAFQDVVLDNLVELMVQYFSAHALSIAFPELAVPAAVQVCCSIYFFLWFLC